MFTSNSPEIFSHPKEERIARTFGTTAPGLPYVEASIQNSGDWLIGGDLEVIQPIKYGDGLDDYRLSPAQLRAEFERLEADAVFAFQVWIDLKEKCCDFFFASDHLVGINPWHIVYTKY